MLGRTSRALNAASLALSINVIAAGALAQEAAPNEGGGAVQAEEQCAAEAKLDWSVAFAKDRELRSAIRTMHHDFQSSRETGLLSLLKDGVTILVVSPDCDVAQADREFAINALNDALPEGGRIVVAESPLPVEVLSRRVDGPEMDGSAGEEAGEETQP